jgi:hypothetical protein
MWHIWESRSGSVILSARVERALGGAIRVLADDDNRTVWNYVELLQARAAGIEVLEASAEGGWAAV